MRIIHYTAVLVVLVLNSTMIFAQRSDIINPYSALGHTPYIIGAERESVLKNTIFVIENTNDGTKIEHNPRTGKVRMFDKNGSLLKERELKSTERAWGVKDLKAEKYSNISPYAYCINNPMKYVDPDGKDGKVTGRGTREDPYIIEAVYYYQNGALGEQQITALNEAANAYNNSTTRVRDNNGERVYVTYNITIEGADNPQETRLANTQFQTEAGGTEYYGNVVGTRPNIEGDEFGSANCWQVHFNVPNIEAGVTNSGMDRNQLGKGVMIHEIGHNLGGEHVDRTSVMQTVNTNVDQNGNVLNHSYPSMSDRFTPKIFTRRDTPRNQPNEGRIWTQRR